MKHPIVGAALLVFTLTFATTIVPACSSGGSGADGGKNGIGANPNVSQSCQTCLSQSTSNDCASKQKACTGDSVCVTLNTCVNNCASVVNSGCVSNCEASASADAIAEWSAWYSCTCADCNAQCSTTFCGTMTSDAGSDAGNDTGVCTADDLACTNDSQCCDAPCASDGYCACIPAEDQQRYCSNDNDCCNGLYCDTQTQFCEN